MKKMWLGILAALIFCAGCGNFTAQTAVTADQDLAGESQTPSEEDLRASDTAILIRKDTSQKKLTFQTAANGARYDLSYTGTTEFYDRYGQSLSVEQLVTGEIAELVLSVHSKTLCSLALSEDAFTLREMERHNFNENRGIVTLGDSNYKMDDNLVVFSDGETGELMDINEGDLLTVRGVGRQVYSVAIEKGHGYLRLKGDEYFRGGWIEVGQKIIKPISENMLLLVPEGEYDMRVTYNGFGGYKRIVIERDKETVTDISDLKGDLLKTGRISFTIHPEDADARLFIDGGEVSYSSPVELEYGVHRMEIKAEGYQTIRKYISVGQEMAAIEIDLDKSDEESSSVSASKVNSELKPEEDNVISGNSSSTSRRSSSSTARSSSSSTRKSSSSSGSSGPDSITVTEDDSEDEVDSDTTETSENNQLYIDSPEGVEVYYDAAYKGVAPVHFTKSEGIHVITLRKEGYVTKSYSITLDSGDQDETYSFSELVKEEDED